jgi:hypothetical protein
LHFPHSLRHPVWIENGCHAQPLRTPAEDGVVMTKKWTDPKPPTKAGTESNVPRFEVPDRTIRYRSVQ